MPDQFTPTPVKGRRAANQPPDPLGDFIAALPAQVGNGATVLADGNLATLFVDTGGRLRVVVERPGGADPISGTVALDDATIGAITGALEAVSLNAPSIAGIVDPLVAGLNDVDLSVATRDDIVARLSAALEAVSLNADTVTALTGPVVAGLDDVDLSVATRDDLVTRITTALEDIGLNVATRDDLVTRLTTALEDIRVTNPITDPVGVRLSDGTAAVGTRERPLVVHSVHGTEAVTDSGLLHAPDVAAGASTTFPAPAGTHLMEVTASSSVRLKAEVLAGTATRRVFFVEAFDSLVYRPEAEIAGVTGLRLSNMDNVLAADVYASIAMGG